MAKDSSERIYRNQMDLVDDEVLKIQKHNDSMIFVEDYLFATPSAAAEAVLGRSSNGWKEWSDDDGNTLDELEDRKYQSKD
jgi:hypothetical protein